MSATPRLELPFLAPGQAQKELLHNEALQLLDMLVAAAVEELPRAAPPTEPSEGACYIVAASPTGEWAGRQQSIAAFTLGGWRFIAPAEGMNVYVRSDGIWGVYRQGSWEFGTLRGTSLLISGQQVIGARQPAIAGPTGGTTIDSQARTAVNQVLVAMRQHGLIET